MLISPNHFAFPIVANLKPVEQLYITQKGDIGTSSITLSLRDLSLITLKRSNMLTVYDPGFLF